MFVRRADPSTEGLQRGDAKNNRTKDVILPPTDENGRFVPDRSREGTNLSSLRTERDGTGDRQTAHKK